MCGRVRCALHPEHVREYVQQHCSHTVRLEDEEFEKRYTPSYNIGPGGTYRLPVAMAPSSSTNDDEVVIAPLVWGLVPSFQKGKPDFFRMFNCRSETMHEKPSFRRLVARNRCIVYTEGFYEWKHTISLGKETKQPYFIHFKDFAIMPMAGLYDCWKDEDGNVLRTCTILTTESSTELSWLHDRMPVILGSDTAQRDWLDPDKHVVKREEMGPYDGEQRLEWYPVTPKMGRLTCQGPECSEKLRTSQKTISALFSVAKKRDIVKEEEECHSTKKQRR